jgi:Na+/H+ antiporter NhaC
MAPMDDHTVMMRMMKSFIIMLFVIGMGKDMERMKCIDTHQ